MPAFIKPIPGFARMGDLRKLLGCTRGTLLLWLQEPDFPRPMRPSRAGWRRWPTAEVLAWAARRQEANPEVASAASR